MKRQVPRFHDVLNKGAAGEQLQKEIDKITYISKIIEKPEKIAQLINLLRANPADPEIGFISRWKNSPVWSTSVARWVKEILSFLNEKFQLLQAYEILNINPKRELDKATLKKKFNQMAIKYHPDKSSDPHAEQKFKEINNARNLILKAIGANKISSILREISQDLT